MIALPLIGLFIPWNSLPPHSPSNSPKLVYNPQNPLMFQVLTTIRGDGLAHDDRKLATMVTIEGDAAHIGGHGTGQQRQCGDCASDVVQWFLAVWQIMPARVAC